MDTSISNNLPAANERLLKKFLRIFPKKIKKVLFINPPDGDSKLFNRKTADVGRYPNYPPYGIGCISTKLLKSKIDVKS